MAPAVFVPKKTSQLRICVNYRELNKRTTKDSYPLPLPDEVQDRLAESIIFSTLDLHSGFWQLPENPTELLFVLVPLWDCMNFAGCPLG